MRLQDLIGETTEYDKKQMLERTRPKSWCKSVSAFANGNGGFLILGIADNDEIIGLEDAKGDAEIISEQIKVKLDPIPAVDLRFEKVDDKELIILRVMNGNETPYYYIGEKNRIAYQRIGNESVPVDAAGLRRLVLRGGDTSYDSNISQYDLADFSFTKLRAVCKQRTGKTFEDSDFESFGLANAEGRLTYAGALLADDSPIKHSRLFCTRWNGLNKASGVVNALDDAEYSGSLIWILENGLNFVKNNSKKRWKKLGDGRIDLPDYPERSIFEGLVNALIHREYSQLGSEVHIDMFDDRLEIYSPGGMYDGTLVQERDTSRISSVRRNPVIADIFERLKYMERRGSGFRKIKEDYVIQYFYSKEMEPEFYSDAVSFILTLKNLNYKEVESASAPNNRNGKKNVNTNGGINGDINDGDNAGICRESGNYDSIYDSGYGSINGSVNDGEKMNGFSDNELLILHFMKQKPSITRSELNMKTHFSLRTVDRIISDLKKRGVIERVGANKTGFWEVYLK